MAITGAGLASGVADSCLHACRRNGVVCAYLLPAGQSVAQTLRASRYAMHVTPEELQSFRAQLEAIAFHCPNCTASAGFIFPLSYTEAPDRGTDNRATL